jgi:hypothetical protein
MIGVAGPAASTLNGLLVLLKWTELMCEPNGTYGTHAGLAPNKQTVERIPTLPHSSTTRSQGNECTVD